MRRSFLKPFHGAANLAARFYGVVLPDEKKVQGSYLSCGAKLVTRRTPGMPFVDVRIHINGAGSGEEHEAGYPGGTAHLYEHIACLHTASYAPGEGRQIVERLGGTPNAMTRPDSMCFSLRIPKEHFQEGLHVTVECVTRPVFAEPVIEIERQTVLSEWLKAHMKDQFHSLAEAATQAAFGNDRYSFSPLGNQESIQSIRKEDMERFFKETFTGANTTILVQGDVKHTKLASYLEEEFHLPKGQPVAVERSAFVGGDLRLPQDVPGIRSIVLTHEPDHRDIKGQTVQNALIYVMGKKIHQGVRARGLSYGVDIVTSQVPQTPFTWFGFDAFPWNTAAGLGCIGDVLETMAEKGDPAGLESFHRAIKASWQANKFSAVRPIDIMLGEELYLGSIQHPKAFAQRSLAVTNEDIRAAAGEMLSRPYVYAAGGVVESLPDPEQVRKMLRMKKTPPVVAPVALGG